MRFSATRRVRWLLAAAGAFVVLGIAGVLFVVDAMRPACGGEIHRMARSPDGKLAVVVFEWDCGATTGFSTQAAVTPWDRPFPRRDEATFLVLSGQHEIAVRWTGDRSIEVGLPGEAQVFRRQQSIQGVAIAYR